MKRILAIAALMLAAAGAQAQQQTGILNSQFRLQGQIKTVDLATARKITFVTTNGYTSNVVITDYDGVQRTGSISLSKLQASPLWKNYVAQSAFVYINTLGANFDCLGNTVISWTGRQPETLNDNCSLVYKIISQSDTN